MKAKKTKEKAEKGLSEKNGGCGIVLHLTRQPFHIHIYTEMHIDFLRTNNYIHNIKLGSRKRLPVEFEACEMEAASSR